LVYFPSFADNKYTVKGECSNKLLFISVMGFGSGFSGRDNRNRIKITGDAGGNQITVVQTKTKLSSSNNLTWNGATVELTGNITIGGITNASGSVIPYGDLVYDLGESNSRWANIYATNVYTGDLHLQNERGNWTLIEEQDMLTVRNNLTGEKFKIMLEKI